MRETLSSAPDSRCAADPGAGGSHFSWTAESGVVLGPCADISELLETLDPLIQALRVGKIKQLTIDVERVERDRLSVRIDAVKSLEIGLEA